MSAPPGDEWGARWGFTGSQSGRSLIRRVQQMTATGVGAFSALVVFIGYVGAASARVREVVVGLGLFVLCRREFEERKPNSQSPRSSPAGSAEWLLSGQPVASTLKEVIRYTTSPSRLVDSSQLSRLESVPSNPRSSGAELGCFVKLTESQPGHRLGARWHRWCLPRRPIPI